MMTTKCKYLCSCSSFHCLCGNPRLGALKYLLIFIDSIIFYLLYWIHVIVLPRPGAQQHVLRNVPPLTLLFTLSFLLSCSVCAIIVKSAHKAAEWKRARERERVSEGGEVVRGRVRQTSTTFAGKSFRIFKRKSLYKSKTDYKCCAISSRNSVGSGRRGRGRWEEMCVGGWGKKIEKGLCVRSQQLRNSWAQLLSSARFSSSLAVKCQLITPPFFLFFHFSSPSAVPFPSCCWQSESQSRK